VPPTALEGLWAIGELGLGGDVRAVKGVLPAALAARRSGARLLVVPQANLVEAALVPDLPVAGADSLAQVGEWLVGRGDRGRPGPPPDTPVPPVEDLADIRGQHQARRALEIAAAGAHNLLLTGPPGAGKTMLARRLPGLLPPLEQDEALEVTQVFSAAGLLGPDAGLIRIRPFRAPHHAISVRAWSAAARSRDPARYPLPTTASCSSTSCPSSPGPRARRSASRSRRARSPSRGP
jgi:magnesium chelatase family protein